MNYIDMIIILVIYEGGYIILITSLEQRSAGQRRPALFGLSNLDEAFMKVGTEQCHEKSTNSHL